MNVLDNFLLKEHATYAMDLSSESEVGVYRGHTFQWGLSVLLWNKLGRRRGALLSIMRHLWNACQLDLALRWDTAFSLITVKPTVSTWYYPLFKRGYICVFWVSNGCRRVPVGGCFVYNGIIQIYVKPAWRRQGIATKLYDTAMKVHKRKCPLRIITGDDKDSNGFYQKMRNRYE